MGHFVIQVRKVSMSICLRLNLFDLLAFLRYCSNNRLNYCLDCTALYKEKRDHRFEVGEERSLIDLALESTPENTKKKAMWAFRLYETCTEWRRSVYEHERMRYKVGVL